MKKLTTTALVCLSVAGVVAAPSFAAQPGTAVHNENANANACWGMDRSFYASEKYFGDNMDIKQSFPTDVGQARAAWVVVACR